MIDLNRQPGESEEHFIWRIGRAYDSGEIDLGWDEIGAIINRQFREDESQYRDSSAYRKPYQSAKRFYESGVFSSLTTDAYIAQLAESKRELEKEKIKLHTEKLEYNRWLREDARDEMLAEKFADAIKQAPALQFPPVIRKSSVGNERRTGILCFGDCHYGAEFQVIGLRGEVINAYSPEIFEKRMQKLLEDTINIAIDEGLDEIVVFELGDSTDGLLRVGQLVKLRYGVVEQSVKYANYIACWLNELAWRIPVRFQMVFGNHTELRFFNQKKGSFKDENTGMWIREIIKARLDGNPNFTMEVNPSGLIFDTIQGYNVLGIHGEVKNLGDAIKDFSLTYNADVHILIGAHKHHLMEETVGVDRDAVTIPSIIGIDDFAISLYKTSRPGASFLVVEKDKGIVTEHRIKL